MLPLQIDLMLGGSFLHYLPRLKSRCQQAVVAVCEVSFRSLIQKTHCTTKVIYILMPINTLRTEENALKRRKVCHCSSLSVSVCSHFAAICLTTLLLHPHKSLYSTANRPSSTSFTSKIPESQNHKFQKTPPTKLYSQLHPKQPKEHLDPPQFSQISPSLICPSPTFSKNPKIRQTHY